jgi:hypothetical protein
VSSVGTTAAAMDSHHSPTYLAHVDRGGAANLSLEWLTGPHCRHPSWSPLSIGALQSPRLITLSLSHHSPPGSASSFPLSDSLSFSTGRGFIAMWKAAARRLVDGALAGSRAARVAQSSPLSVRFRLRLLTMSFRSLPPAEDFFCVCSYSFSRDPSPCPTVIRTRISFPDPSPCFLTRERHAESIPPSERSANFSLGFHVLQTSLGSKNIVGVFYKAGEYADKNPNFVGCVEGALGIRNWLESQGHHYILTDDKEGPNSGQYHFD